MQPIMTQWKTLESTRRLESQELSSRSQLLFEVQWKLSLVNVISRLMWSHYTRPIHYVNVIKFGLAQVNTLSDFYYIQKLFIS